jgi:small nuclear ribonucleoprotein (snRNP)-like protein
MARSPKSSPPEKVVVHLIGGRTFKGSIQSFDPTGSTVRVRSSRGSNRMEVNFEEVKAIFYVKTYAGNREYREKVRFVLSEPKGKRIMVRFKDGEILLGYADRDFGERGGSLSILTDPRQKGFFLFPADPGSNNTKVFVVISSLIDARQL